MGTYLKAALGLAGVSILLAVVVLGLLFLDPFQLGPNAVPADRMGAVAAIAGVSSAISTVIALVIGAIAVTALIVSERSETRATEQLKLDFAGLASTLIALRDRALLYTNVEMIDTTLDPFEHEREALTKVLTSSTGWAIHAWSHEKGNETFDDVYPGLAGLVDLTTLELDQNRQGVINAIAARSVGVFDQICSITEPDFRRMSTALNRLSDGVSRACVTLQTDRLAELQHAITKAEAESYRAPTEHELAQLMALADERIGGEAGTTVEHFGRQAIDDAPDARRNFARLIDQLLDVQLPAEPPPAAPPRQPRGRRRSGKTP